MEGYFSHKELTALTSTSGKTLRSVLYHYWQNKTNAGEIFEFIDKVELGFTDNSRIVFATNTEDEGGMCIPDDFDAEKEKLLLLKDFGGKIDMRTTEAVSTELWREAAGKKILEIQLVDDGENTYRNDAALLSFGELKIEIRPGVEGLLVELFEEV